MPIQKQAPDSGKRIHPLLMADDQYDDMREHIGDMFVKYAMYEENYENIRHVYHTVAYLDKLLMVLAGENIPATEIKEVSHE